MALNLLSTLLPAFRPWTVVRKTTSVVSLQMDQPPDSGRNVWRVLPAADRTRSGPPVVSAEPQEEFVVLDTAALRVGLVDLVPAE